MFCSNNHYLAAVVLHIAQPQQFLELFLVSYLYAVFRAKAAWCTFLSESQNFCGSFPSMADIGIDVYNYVECIKCTTVICDGLLERMSHVHGSFSLYT